MTKKKEPVYIEKLAKALGSERAVAEILECNVITITRALDFWEVTGIYEIAAKFYFKNEFELNQMKVGPDSKYDDSDDFIPSREAVETALAHLEDNNKVNCIQLAHLAAGARRYLTGAKNHDALEKLLPDADEISFSYFKSNGHWAMWATKSILVDKDDGQRIRENSIFAREDGATPLECIFKHQIKEEKKG